MNIQFKTMSLCRHPATDKSRILEIPQIWSAKIDWCLQSAKYIWYY